MTWRMAAGTDAIAMGAYAGLGRVVERVAATAFLRRRLARGKEHAQRWPERLGVPGAARPDGALIWVHAASVGETVSVLPLMAMLRQGTGAEILLTTGTVSSAALAEQRLGPGMRHQFVPLDLPRSVSRFLDHWRPQAGLLVESELWPGLIAAAAARGIPLGIVNARLSERSAARWRRLPVLIRPLLSAISVVVAQSEEDARRFAELGAAAVPAGNLKFDAPAPPADPAALDALKRAVGDRPVFAAASTHPGEEEAVLAAHAALAASRPDLLTLLAPRHPARAEEILALAAGAGLAAARRSRGELPEARTALLLFDTIGELGLLYRLAPVAFVGGSLVPHGGQNPLEPAKLGSAVLHGPHVHNFREIYGMLDKAGAATLVGTPADLGREAERLLASREVASAQADRARRLVARSEGATRRTLEALRPLLPGLARAGA